MSRNIGIGEVRTKLLDTDHKQWNCGMGLYDPNKVFFKDDPNGKVIVDGKLCIIVRSKSESNLVMIGGKFYKFVQIGDQIWLAENLDLKTTNSVGREGYPEFGLYYPYSDIKEIENSVDGWHVPTEVEIRKLLISDTPANARRVQSTNYKNVWPDATNSTDFSAVPAAYIDDTNLNRALLWFHAGYVGIPADKVSFVNSTPALSFCVRLIKDTEPVTIGGKTYKTAKIGNQIWTIENLDYPVDGAVYYNNDPSQSYGLLYSPTAIDALDGIVEGWHVPYAGEIDELSDYVSDNSKLLKSITSWATNPGTDNYRFDAKAGGSYNSSTFSNKGDYGLFYSQTKNSSNQNYRMNLSNGSNTITRGHVNNNNYLSVRLIKDTEPVEIGGRKYKTIKIGNQLWMMENLDYQFEGLNIGGATLQSDVHAWYFNNDPAQSEGLLYNGYAAKYLADHPELLPEGWKVPESSDFGVLQVTVGGANTAGTMLKNPGTMNGINYYGFNGLATGMIRSNGAFTDRTTYLRLWTPNISQTDETAQQFLTLESDKNTATVVSFPNDQVVAYSIRLVKNLSDENSLSKGLLSTVVEDEGKEDIDEKPVEDEKKTEEVIGEKEIIKEENKR